MSKHLCVIPAKAASTRLKKKNILLLNGKPILQYVVEAAQKSGIFDKIIVSTESDEVAEVVKTSGAEVHMRPEYLAHDPYGVVDVVLELLESRSEYQAYERLTIMLATSPLIEASDIQKADLCFRNSHFASLMSVAPTPHNAQRAVFIRDGIIRPLFDEKLRKKSQELEQTYHINAAITMVQMQTFLRTKSYFSEPLGAYVLSEEKAVDIDTEFDYRFAQFLMEQRGAQ